MFHVIKIDIDGCMIPPYVPLSSFANYDNAELYCSNKSRECLYDDDNGEEYIVIDDNEFDKAMRHPQKMVESYGL